MGHDYHTEPRGAISIKGKGMMNTYFVTGTKVSAAESVDDGIEFVSDASKEVEANNFEMVSRFPDQFRETSISPTKSSFCRIL